MDEAKNILILGALPGTNQEKIALYEVLVEACQTASPTCTIDSPLSPQVSVADVFERRELCFQKIALANLIIGDQTSPSTGQGVEIREAELQNKPVIVTAEMGSKISGLVESSPVLKNTILYTSREDLKSQLVRVLNILDF